MKKKKKPTLCNMHRKKLEGNKNKGKLYFRITGVFFFFHLEYLYFLTFCNKHYDLCNFTPQIIPYIKKFDGFYMHEYRWNMMLGAPGQIWQLIKCNRALFSKSRAGLAETHRPAKGALPPLLRRSSTSHNKTLHLFCAVFILFLLVSFYNKRF